MSDIFNIVKIENVEGFNVPSPAPDTLYIIKSGNSISLKISDSQGVSIYDIYTPQTEPINS